MESVLVAVGSKTNSQLIIDVLKHNYDIQPYEKGIKIPSRLDLIIVDGRTLDSFRKRHIGLKNESDPVFLPILLITSKKGVGLMTGGMWRLVDEVITTPISKAELFARVEGTAARTEAIRSSLPAKHKHEGMAEEYGWKASWGWAADSALSFR